MPAPIDGPTTADDAASLSLANGLTNLTLTAHSDSDHLIRGRFRGDRPRIDVEGREVAIHSGRGPLTRIRELLNRRQRPAGEISVRAGIGWRIDIYAGVTDVRADLRQIELRGLDVAAGVRHLEISLPRPEGRVYLDFTSGVTGVRLHRPEGVPVEISASSGVVRLRVDERHFPPIGAALRWSSPDFSEESDHYSLRLTAGVIDLAIETYPAGAQFQGNMPH